MCNYAWARLPAVHPGDDGDLHQEELLRALRRRLHARARPQGPSVDVLVCNLHPELIKNFQFGFKLIHVTLLSYPVSGRISN